MKTFLSLSTCLLAAMAAATACSRAGARAEYKKAFEELYTTQDANPKFVKSVEAAKCNVCHTGKNKKARNAYGKELAKLLKEEKDPQKIQSALEDVAKQHTNPKKEDSPTFGDRIKSGKLPGGG